MYVGVFGNWQQLNAHNIPPILISGLIGIFAGDTLLFASLNRVGPRRSSILFAMNAPLAAILGWIDRRPAAASALEKMELAFKAPVFGCKACGNCVLGEMEYVCPMTCPKSMRNGPCGGAMDGQCEVVDQPCIWVNVYDRAKSAGRIGDLKTFIPPPNRALQGTSSFINLFLKRDVRPETRDSTLNHHF